MENILIPFLTKQRLITQTKNIFRLGQVKKIQYMPEISMYFPIDILLASLVGQSRIAKTGWEIEEILAS